MILVPANTIQNLSSKQGNFEDDDLDAVDDESDLEFEEVCRKFRVEIPPEHEIPLVLKFTPKLNDTYLFELPVSVVGIDE
mmetsp:Transcript_1695/g.184  ORF Transcript_1695/g.184 Transcript_1695/m.184 type:complete len:80 (-) Transcript_1695:1819-2058(-)